MKARIYQLYLILIFLTFLAFSYARTTPDANPCISDDECRAPFTTCDGSYCIHKYVFPVLWQEFAGIVIIIVTIALGNTVGIGGGAIIITTCYTLFSFTPGQAVAVTNMIIFFAVFSGYLVNFTKKHPLKNATLVDYCIVQCQMPLIGLGSFIGAQANELFPRLVIFILLFLALLYILITTILKGIDMMKKEDVLLTMQGAEYTERAKKLLLVKEQKRNGSYVAPNINESFNESSRSSIPRMPIEENKDGEEMDTLIVDDEEGIVTINSKGIEPIDILDALGAKKADYTDDEITPTLEKIFAGESNHLTIDKFILVCVPVFSILLVSLFRGSSAFKSIIGVRRCNVVDFVLFGLEVLILLVFSTVNIVLLKKDHQTRKAAGYKFVKGDIEWDTPHIIAFAILAFIGGFITSSVGLSSEVLFTPFYIKMGAIPSVAGVTSQFLGIWATLSASIVFSFLGYMHFGYGLWLGFFAIVATVFGSEAIGGYIGRSSRFSNAMWIIAFLVFISLLAESAVSIQRTIDYDRQGKDMWEFGNYCN